MTEYLASGFLAKIHSKHYGKKRNIPAHILISKYYCIRWWWLSEETTDKLGGERKIPREGNVSMDMNWQSQIHETFKSFGLSFCTNLAMLWDRQFFPVACSCHEFTGNTDSCLISGALGNFYIVIMCLQHLLFLRHVTILQKISLGFGTMTVT